MRFILVLCACSMAAHAETRCFHTAVEAAAQAGVRDGEGFRLEGVRADLLGGGRWATVRWCPHPEWPGILVKTSAQATRAPLPVALIPVPAAIAVRAGAAVRVLSGSAVSRLQTAGVAQASGAVGERIAVRLLGAGADSGARLADGIVRADGVVELEVAR